jgi:tetratricopeptide (TPR) repeat protein
VRTWRALQVVAQRGGHGRSDLPEPPFVGRDEELRQLKELLATTSRDHRARLVSVMGPGGIGKSRLAWELEKYVDGVAGAIYWHRGRSPSYGQGITFWALGEMVRRRAGLAEDDDAARTRAGIAATVAEYVADEQDREWIEPALLTLLGVEPAPPGGRDVLFGAWRMFFEHVAGRGPTVLLFEDLQWADTGLLDFIESLLEWSRGVPILVVTLARPELLETRPGWASGTRHRTHLALEPLDAAAMRELLEGFVPGLPEAAVRTILERADGVPLYAVETVRALVADRRLELVDGRYRPVGELATLAIPDSLRSLIASRLDALEPANRSLIADASVLGHAFTIEGLAAVSGRDPGDIEARLRAMIRRELLDLDVDPRSPERGQFRFVQSLIREVAYGTLARRDRRARHLAAARFYESLGDDELAGALATHYVAAHAASDAGPEADAVAVQARLALGGAADRAAGLGAHDQAVRYLRSAIEMTAAPRDRAGLLLRAAQSANIAARHEEAEALAREAETLARDAGDRATQAKAANIRGNALIDLGQHDQAMTVLEAALTDLPDDAPAAPRVELLATTSRILMRSDRYAEAVVVADRALALAEPMRDGRVIAEALNNKGASLTGMGRYREGIALLRGAVDVAREGGFVSAELRALSNLSGTLEDVRESRRVAIEAKELALRMGHRSNAAFAAGTVRFDDFALAEDWDAVIDLDAASTVGVDEVASAIEMRWISATGLMLAARGDPIDELLGRLAEIGSEIADTSPAIFARQLASMRDLLAGDHVSAYRAVEEPMDDPLLEAWMLRAAWRAALWGGDADRVRDAAERLGRSPGGDALAVAGRVAASASTAALDGRRDDALAGFRESIDLLRAIHDRFGLAERVIDLLFVLGPGDPGTPELAAEARAIFERVAARPYLATLDELMQHEAGAASEARPGGEPIPDRAAVS